MIISKNKNKINYIMCNDEGHFECYGSITDLCVLYAFITYKLLKKGIDINFLTTSICNSYDLYNNLN